MEQNEVAAAETIRILKGALQRYASRFPKTGFPFHLRTLTISTEPENIYTGNEPLLDESFTADPLIKNGYVFQYLLTSVGDGGEHGWGSYEITATPVEFGKTGSKNYLANPNLHVTSQNRPATDDDPAPQD